MMNDTKNPAPQPQKPAPTTDKAAKPTAKKEFGGRTGPEPTRYGDWEMGGKCVDF